MLVYFRSFAPGITEDQALASMGRVNGWVPFMNLNAGLAMSDVGLRSDGPLPAADYKRALAGMTKLVQTFKEYRPAAGTTQPAATQRSASTPGA